MMRIFFLISISSIVFLSTLPSEASLVISEIACATSGDDWVEIRYQSDTKSSILISPLFVTMYYGTNENISSDPVTLYSYDRPETPYDDRFAVVHLCRPGVADETDLTGDTDHNGRIDVYCDNYSGSLWNAECAVAIDTDDDPANGMIDFVSWSDNDGSPSDTILSYIDAASSHAQWVTSGSATQSCMIAVASGGLKSFESIIRTSGDTNSNADFSVTACQTPGRENVLKTSGSSSKIFHPEKSRILVIPGSPDHRSECAIQVNERCSMRMRVFTDIGQPVFDSELIKEVSPGRIVIPWRTSGGIRTGLYIALIEANISSGKKTQSAKIFFIVTRYR